MTNGHSTSEKAKVTKLLIWIGSAMAASIIGVLVGRVFELGPFRPPPDIQITQFSVSSGKGLDHLPSYAPFRALAEEETKAEVVLYNGGGRTAVECDLRWEPLVPVPGFQERASSLQRFSIPARQSISVSVAGVFPQPTDKWRASTGSNPAEVFSTSIIATCFTNPRKGEMYEPTGQVETIAYRDLAVFATPEASRQ